MDLVVSAFIFFSLVIVIMSVGVLFGRSPIKGTCGGLNQLMGSQGCEICGDDVDKCNQMASNSRSSRDRVMRDYIPDQDLS